jgi:hypothetical protein
MGSLPPSCAVSDDLSELRDPTKIFYDNASVKDLIQFIGNVDDNNTLTENCVYGKLKYKYNYDVLSTRHSELWFLPDKALYDTPEKCKKYLEDKGLSLLNKADEREGEINQYDDNEKQKKGLPNIEPLTRGLVRNLLDNSFFGEKYCFLIVHNQKIHYMKKGVDRTREVFEKKCVKLNSENRDNIKDVIKEIEIDAFKKGKSLIILTGSMLRLGVSLPCVDIAFNFDGVQSIDANYQTMFRVLTERPGKEYGYYFDFFPDRAITFIYEYNDSYSNKANKPSNVNRLEELQSLLYLFNYNGLGITSSKETTERTLRLYNTLIEKLKLTDSEMKKRYITNIRSRFSRLLEPFNDKTILEKFSKFSLNVEKGKTKIKIFIKPGDKKKRKKVEPNIVVSDEGNDGDDKDEDENIVEEEEKDETEISKEKIAEFLSLYVPIISLFSLENNCASESSSFEDCLNNMIQDVEENVKDGTKMKTYCREKCSENLEPLGCYMNLIMDYNKKDFIDSLKVIKLLYDEKYKNDAEFIGLIDTINIIYTSIRDEMGRKSNLIMDMTTDDIQAKIEEYLPVRKAEKDKYGEVFTPTSLIREMLDKLPKSVWKNPNYKWLDPANGIGNFPMIAYEMLNDGLSNVDGFKDEQKRKKHIIENMLYMVELNPKNVAVSRKIFGKSANIYCGSFLEDGWQKAFGVEKFDVIMGNPPFNDEKEGKQTGSRAKNSLWDIFVIKSIELLNINGYLGFIHPPPWRGLSPNYHKLWDIMSKKQMLYLRIYSKKDGNTYFKSSTRFDVYVLKNTINTNPTEVIDELGNKHLLKLSKMPFLPNYAYKEINKILTTENEGIDVIQDYSYANTNKNVSYYKIKKFKYPVVHTINLKGLGFLYSDTNKKGHFGISKVILNVNENQYSYPEQNDYEGKYGMSQNSFGIPIKSKSEGEQILEAIQTPMFKKIIAATKWRYQTEWIMFKYFKKDWYKIILLEDAKNKTRKNRGSKTSSSSSSSSSKSKKTIKKRSKANSLPEKNTRRKRRSKTKTRKRAKSV